MTFIYLHGFNSDGEGWKADALRRQFPTATIWAPDLPANPQEVVHLIAEYLETAEPETVLVGTSLGGFYAYWASARFDLPAFLFNPSLSPHQTLAGRGIGQFKTWTKGRDYHFKEEYLPILEQLKQDTIAVAQIENLYFFLATDDDVLDHSAVPHLYAEASIRWYEGAGHGFSKFEKALKEMKRAQLPFG
ncbi:MAG: YqiA/YcfP family alpha/beta fold hydrolase [Bacteroidota bacterium]